MALVIEFLPSKCTPLSLNPRTTKRWGGGERERQRNYEKEPTSNCGNIKFNKCNKSQLKPSTE
jgi:hypothetical protein